jgi:hypothetical protein
VMLLKRIVECLKVLVAVTLFDGLVFPTLTLPKARLVGLTFREPSPLSANARLAFARPSSRRTAKQKPENAKVNDLGRNMINPPESNPVTNFCESA